MFDKLSSKNIWVSSMTLQTGDGSFENPYSKIRYALENATGGSVVILFPGVYDEKLTLRDLCGSVEEPITITAYDESGEDVVSNSEWYFHSVKDFIVRGVIFRKTVNTAISITGESHRNSIKDCVFDECGETSGCAVFFGGSGGDCNVVENCEFIAPKSCKNHISVMISKNLSIRFCRFNNCATALLAGSDENISGLFGAHEICDCLFENCEIGVKIKIGGTQVYGNIFRNTHNAVVNSFGTESEVFENRFENCERALVVDKDDITIKENCFINSVIYLENKANKNALAVLISENTFVSDDDNEVIVSQQIESAAFITKNIFYKCKIGGGKNISDNIFEQNDIFVDSAKGDFSVNTDYGCKSGAQKRLEIEDIPQIDIAELFEKQKLEYGHIHGDDCSCDKNHKSMSGEMLEQRDLFLKSMYFQDEDEDEYEKEQAEAINQQYLRPIGIDGELEDN